jgi:predicted AAA+ superfamily ATPase
LSWFSTLPALWLLCQVFKEPLSSVIGGIFLYTKPGRPIFFAGSGPDPDEIQYAPGLLSAIKEEVDKDRRRVGRFFLSGSQVFPLMEGLSQSLAGRAALFELLGFSWAELAPGGNPLSLKHTFDSIHRGFFPDPALRVSPTRYYAGYVATYLERDIRQVQNVQDLGLFQSFLELLAARVGSPLNLNEISRLAGVSFTNARRWLSLLETTRLVFLLPSYSRNVTKRVVKSPKIYFTDTGLLAYLLKYPDGLTLQNGPLAGPFFENMMVMEVLKKKFNTGASYALSYYRDSGGNEVDLILDSGRDTLLLEFKLAKTPRSESASVFERLDGPLANGKSFVLSFWDQKTALSRRTQSLPWWKINDVISAFSPHKT